MKAKLIKEDKHFVLFEGTRFISTTDCADGTTNKLSLKNCQEIERGYDLDGVVNDIVKTIVPDDRGKDIWYSTSMAIGKLCFQKALELLITKKFTEQQTEWDVEIEMEYHPTNHASGLELTGNNLMDVSILENYKPKLDSEGCLILKRKSE